MKKKASDYRLGDAFQEADRVAGTVVSLATDETRPAHAFILVRSDRGLYTVYACLRDAVCEPYLARNIPEGVMRRFLFDLYFGGKEPKAQPLTVRVPVPIPELSKPKNVGGNAEEIGNPASA